MSFKAKLISILALLSISFAAGRYSITSTQQITATMSEDHSDRTLSTEAHTITTKNPDGTVVVDTTVSKTLISNKDKINESLSQSKTTAKKSVNISLLSGYDYRQADRKLIYGLAVSANIIGPITAGVWGVTNGPVGISLGVDF